jgi:tape measure domain-containing protein
MANAASTIEIELEIRQAINRLDRLQRELTESTQSFNKAAQATRKFEGAINKAKAGLVAFFAAISIQKLAQLSDAMTQFENRVKLATNSLVQQVAVQQQLFQVAQKTALPLQDVSQLYSRLRIAAEQLGASQRDLINLTETVGLALLASGTSAASAQGALLQLGQALNSPRVQAEEFNSLIDGMPNLLREVEKQLGLTAGGLKKFVTDGQLSNKKFFDAILASQKALTEQAKSSASTIEQANQRVANSFTSLIGTIDDKLGASAFFTGFIDSLATGIDKLSNFLGLTTQATGPGGESANLDEVIKEQTGLITDLEASFKGLSVYATTQIMAISEAFEDPNLTIEEYTKKVEAFVKSYTEFYDKVESGELPGFPALQFDPETQEQLFLSAEQASREFELIFKFIAQGFKAFENLNGEAEKYLTYLERITNALSEQLRLLELSEENATRTAGAIVSGVSGAGANASRASNIAQSKSFEEATAKLILSNEKVAAAIDKSFELLFDVLDPFIDVLGDLISAINKLIGALLDSVDNAISDLGNQINLFNGTFTRGINQLAFDLSGGGLGLNTYNQEFNTTAQNDAMQLAFFQSLATLGSGFNFAPEIKVLDGQIVYTPGLQVTSEILSDFLSTAMTNGIDQARADILSDFAQFSYDVRTSADISDSAKQTMLANAEIAKGIILDQLNTAYFVEVSEQVQKEVGGVSEGLKSQIDLINFSNLTAEEQIEFRYRETQALLLQQKITAATIKTDEERLKALNAIQNAERLALTLMNKQKEELQKLNEERERELNLQNQNNLLSALIDVFKDFEKGLRDISEIIDGLNTQINDLLFSDFNLAPASDSLQMATETYGDLFAAALDPEATEEDVKAFQGFVDTYLRGARDVFKSSTAYRQIFDQVLVDLQKIGLAYGQSAPVNLIENIKDELESLETEFGTSLTTLIQELDRLGTVFANQSYAYSGVISVDLGTIDTTFDSSDFNKAIDSLNVNIANGITSLIHTLDTTFDSSDFNKAIDSLNVNIANGITSLIHTLDASKTAIDDFNATGSVSPVNPVPTESTDLVGLYGTGSTYSTLSGFNPLQSNITGASGGSIELISKSAIHSAADANELIQTIVTAQISKYGNAENVIADAAYAAVSGGLATSTGRIENTTIVYGAQNQSDLQRLIKSILDNTDLKLVGSYNLPGFRYGGFVDPLDTIPAMLSAGEYILSPETVRRYGVSNLNRLNAGDSAAINATSDPEVKRLLAELIVAVRENDTEVNVYTDMEGQTKASIEEFRSELRERTRRQGDKFLPARYI